MTAKIHKDFKPLVVAARDAGWKMRHNKGKQGLILYPTGKHAPTVIPCTPGSFTRGLENKKAELRRAGLTV